MPQVYRLNLYLGEPALEVAGNPQWLELISQIDILLIDSLLFEVGLLFSIVLLFDNLHFYRKYYDLNLKLLFLSCKSGVLGFWGFGVLGFRV